MIKFVECYKEKKEKKLHDSIYNEVFSYIRDCINGASYVTVNNYLCEGRDRMVTIRRGTPCRFISVSERRIGIGLIFRIGISHFDKKEPAFFYYSFVLNKDVKVQIENFHSHIKRNFIKINNDN